MTHSLACSTFHETLTVSFPHVENLKSIIITKDIPNKVVYQINKQKIINKPTSNLKLDCKYMGWDNKWWWLGEKMVMVVVSLERGRGIGRR